MKNITVLITVLLLSFNAQAMKNEEVGGNEKAKYSRKEIRRRCGTTVDLEYHRQDEARFKKMVYDYKKQFKKEFSAEKVAMTGHNWRPLMSSIENQGYCDNCWCHAVTGVVEGLLHDLYGSNINIDLDEYEIMEGCNKTCGNTGTTTEALKYVLTNGISCEDGINSAPNFDDAYYAIVDTTRIYGISAIKSALNSSPVTASFFLYDDFDPFFENNPTGIYRCSFGPTWLYPFPYAPGHSVVIVDYDDSDPNPDNHYWIC